MPLSAPIRKQYKRVLSSVVTIQKNYRAHFWRRVFLRLRVAAVVLQKHQRGRQGRSLCHSLREEKRRKEEEERRRREEEEERRRVEEERRQMEEERRRQEEEEELRRRRKEEEEKEERLLAEEMKRREEEEEEQKQKMEADTDEKRSDDSTDDFNIFVIYLCFIYLFLTGVCFCYFASQELTGQRSHVPKGKTHTQTHTPRV